MSPPPPDDQERTVFTQSNLSGAGTPAFEQPETVLNATYEFLSVSGWGGMSVIYKARHRLTRKLVAIKMLHALLVNDAALRRFEREANTISRLRHPNIISVHEFGVSDQGQAYMVMDFVEGSNLAELIKTKGALTLEESIPRFLQICDALEHAHQQGILHRDLKPSNVMLCANEGIFEDTRIVDFGIAKLLDKGGVEAAQLTQTGELFGSPLYMSPEQCRGDVVDKRSDIYSMGCVIYETLTGSPPFYGDTVVRTIMMQLNDIPRPLSQARPDLKFSSTIESLVEKALAKDPNDRFQSMEELKFTLLEIQPNQEFSGKQKKRSAQRHKNLTIPASVYVALLAFFLVAIALFQWRFTTNKTKADAVPKVPAHVDLASNIKEQKQAIRDFAQQTLMGEHQRIDDKVLKYCFQIDLKWPELWLDNAYLVTDSGAIMIAEQKSLRKLSLEGTKITDKTLASIQNLNLDWLFLGRTHVTDAGVRYLTGMKELEQLHLYSTKVTDACSESLNQLHNLKKLLIGKTEITNKFLNSIKGNSTIEYLDLHGTNITDDGIPFLNSLKNLRYVDLSVLPVTDRSLASLRHKKGLNELIIANTKITNEGLKYLKDFDSLNRLRIDSNKIDDEGAAYIAHSPIRRLFIESTKITDKGMHDIASMPGLIEFDCSWTTIGDEGITLLADHKDFEYLDLRGTKVTEAGLNRLSKLTQLKNINVEYCPNLRGSLKTFRDQHPYCNIQM